MEWFKFYANTPRRLAIRRLDANGFRLWVEGRCYIASVETDGLIPTEELASFGTCGKAKVAAQLVKELLWLPCDDGWIDACWLDEQDSYERLVQRRKATSERVAKHRSGAGNAVTNSVGSASRVEEKREEKKEREDAALPQSCDHGADSPRLCALCRAGSAQSA